MAAKLLIRSPTFCERIARNAMRCVSLHSCFRPAIPGTILFFLGCHSAWKAVSVCIIYYANFPGKFCGKQDMRAWRDCGTLRAHKSPQSMYYIGELRTIRPHPSPPVPHPNSKGKFSLGIEEIRLPPSELFISPPSTPFSGVGGLSW